MEGFILSITPFMIPTKGSLYPKSVVKVIMGRLSIQTAYYFFYIINCLFLQICFYPADYINACPGVYKIGCADLNGCSSCEHELNCITGIDYASDPYYRNADSI